MNARESTFLLLALLLVPQAVQADARSHCAQAIEHLGFETSDYVFEQGGFFSFDTHRFGTVACEVDSEGQIRQIARGRQLLAEGDYIGPEVLEQRDRILALARQERDGAMEERTVAIDAAREAYRSQIEQIDLAERATLSELVARSSPFSEDKETIVDSEPPSQGQTSEAPADDPIDPAPVPQGDRAGTIAPEKSEEGAAGVGTETIDPPQETERDASTETENATSGKPIRMYVVADRLTRRTCPSTACGKVGTLMYREAVEVHEKVQGWGRITAPYDAGCVGGRSQFVDSGNARCEPGNGIIDNNLSEWVSLKYLESTQPADPSETATAGEELVARSDDFQTYRTEFMEAARELIESGRCSENDFEEMGGWMWSPTKGEGIYFIYCGGLVRENRIYLDVRTRRIFQ